MVSELSERELFALLKSIYRALQKSFHPDTGQRAEEGRKAVELNLAFEALDLDKNQPSFRRHRKAYMARRPESAYKSALILKNRLEDQYRSQDLLADVFLAYLAQGAAWERLESASPPLVSLPAKGVLLGLFDVALNSGLRQASWLLGSNYKQIEIEENGAMSVKNVGRSRFSRSDYIHLIGSVPVEALDLGPLLEKPPAKSFRGPTPWPSPSGGQPREPVLNLVSRDNFKGRILQHLKPVLAERSYLFSLNKAEYLSSGRISLEGVIIKLEFLDRPRPGP
jgi:hypothetical protein